MTSNESHSSDQCHHLDYDNILSLKSKRLGIIAERNRSKVHSPELDDQLEYLDYRIESLTNCIDLDLKDPWKLSFEPYYED